MEEESTYKNRETLFIERKILVGSVRSLLSMFERDDLSHFFRTSRILSVGCCQLLSFFVGVNPLVFINVVGYHINDKLLGRFVYKILFFTRRKDVLGSQSFDLSLVSTQVKGVRCPFFQLRGSYEGILQTKNFIEIMLYVRDSVSSNKCLAESVFTHKRLPESRHGTHSWYLLVVLEQTLWFYLRVETGLSTKTPGEETWIKILTLLFRIRTYRLSRWSSRKPLSGRLYNIVIMINKFLIFLLK